MRRTTLAPPPRSVKRQIADRAERCRIGSQPVGDNPARRKAVLLKQFHHEFLCGLCIPSALDEEIQHLTLVVDRPPEPVFTAADRNHHFIEVPITFHERRAGRSKISFREAAAKIATLARLCRRSLAEIR